MVERDDSIMKLVFVKSAKESELENIKEFWEFIRQHPELQPYIPSFDMKREQCEQARKSTQTDRNEEFEVGIVSATPKTSFPIPPKCHVNAIFRSKSFKLADEIEETYESLNNEMMALEKRKQAQEFTQLEATDEDSWEEIILSSSTEDFHFNQ